MKRSAKILLTLLLVSLLAACVDKKTETADDNRNALSKRP